MTETRVTWSEEASDIYQRIAAIAVPQRAEQLAAMLTLLPFDVDDEFNLVELGSGEGRWAWAVLNAFPDCRITALDGSESMRQATTERLEQFAGRFTIESFDLLRDDWWHHVEGAGAVVSSLAVHHLDGPGKRLLFSAMQQRIGIPGALLIADIILPANSRANAYFAGSYDCAAREQSIELVDSEAYFEDFLSEEWNLFRYPDDEWDKPSRLFDQLRWLEEAGFSDVDCFWMNAGHALYGGFTGIQSGGGGLDYERALEIAGRAIA